MKVKVSDVDAAAASARWGATLFAYVDAASVAVFRIGFGSVMVLWATVELVTNRVADHYINTAHFFKYPGLGWLPTPTTAGIYSGFALLWLSAAAIALGVAYRTTTVIFWITFSYLFLLDQTLYQNHYYLVWLLGFLLCFIPAHRCFRLLSSESDRHESIPRWCLWLLRFQISCVYALGGVAKLHGDWLSGTSMRNCFAGMSASATFGAGGQIEWLVQVLTWGGLLFDLLIVPALLWKKSRSIAVALVVLFHLTNALLFPIGIFPWLMLVATTLFFEPDWPRQMLSACGLRSAEPGKLINPECRTLHHRLTLTLLTVYVVLQLIIPFRHFLYPGNVDWTEEGHAFAWHMMLRGKASAVRFHVRDPQTGRTGVFPLKGVLQSHQVARMSRDPRLIQDFARFIASACEKRGMPNVEVRAFVLCSLNGRKPQLLIDPQVDLTRIPANSGLATWIYPLREPTLAKCWTEPLRRWEDLVMRDPHLPHPKMAESDGK